jgi:para-nitrobenzyl esterase
MSTNTFRVMSTAAAVVFAFAITSSELALAGGQKSSGLENSSWQLVKFQGGDDTTLVPDDKSKYTITFGSNGRATVRVDCNRGGSSWKQRGTSELQFGSWSMTRAKCPAGSLHDRIVRDGAAVRSYVIKDGHLFLSGMAAGGYYELEPLATPKRRRSRRG